MSQRHRLGLSFECHLSEVFHSKGIPLLISPIFLRQKGLGQVDLARIFQGKVELWEVKHSPIITRVQMMRLRGAANYLARIFARPPLLKFVSLKEGQSDCQKVEEYLCYYI